MIWGVFAPQRALDDRFTISQRSQDQGAVRNALGTWHNDFRAHGLVERDYFNEIGDRHGF